MKPSRRILEYRRLAEMLQVQPCAEHARLFIDACEQDDREYEEMRWSEHYPTFTEAEQIIMHIGEFHRPDPCEGAEGWVHKASASLKLIRDYLATRG